MANSFLLQNTESKEYFSGYNIGDECNDFNIDIEKAYKFKNKRIAELKMGDFRNKDNFEILIFSDGEVKRRDYRTLRDELCQLGIGNISIVDQQNTRLGSAKSMKTLENVCNSYGHLQVIRIGSVDGQTAIRVQR